MPESHYNSLQLVGCMLAFSLIAATRTHAEASPRELVLAATDAYRDAKYREARELFAQLHALDPDAETWSMLGACDFHLESYAKAIDELETALVTPKHALSGEQVHELDSILAHARSHVGQLTLETRPKDATLELDDKPVVGDHFWLDVGQHTLNAAALGYRPSTARLEILAGEVRHKVIALESDAVYSASERPAVPTRALTIPAEHKSDQPLLQRWWFWTAAGAVVAGGVAAVLIATQPAPAPTRVAADYVTTAR